jgi:serine/threonine-protein kinase
MSISGLPRIGRYDVITLLAEGGMARVYLALARGPASFNKLVVIKQIRPEFAWDREFVTMFFDEARIAARLNHPNVVHTYEVIEEQGQYVLVMEYLEGQPLTEVLRRIGRANMPLEEHLWMLTQVLSGLDHAHELRDFDGSPLNIVHRDVSPSNVFVTYNGDVKLVDFGIAKAVGAMAATQHGTIKGKIGYAAPEQCLGRPVDPRTDLFAVGVMLWEALAGKRRKFGESVNSTFQARVSGQEPKIREVAPDVPHMLAEICDRATALNPDDRYRTASEFLQDLERYLAIAPRRVASRDVAALLSTHFAQERVERRKHIEEQLTNVSYTSSRPQPGFPPPTATEIGSQSAQNTWGAPVPNFRPSFWMSARKPMIFGMVGLCAALAAAVAFSRGGAGEADKSLVLAPTGGAAAATATSLRAATPSSTNEPESGTSTLIIQVRPENATLTLDGKRLSSNPFIARVPKDSKAHTLRVSAVGYESVERTLSYGSDLNIELALKSTGAPVAVGRRAAAVVHAPAAEKTTERKAVERPDRIEPGMDMVRPAATRPQRQLDDKDPYAQ